MSNTYGTIITTKGAAIIADCIVNGGQLVISEAAAGDGNGAYYQPSILSMNVGAAKLPPQNSTPQRLTCLM